MKKYLQERKKCIAIICLLLYPVCNFCLLECYTHNPFQTMRMLPWLLNMALFWLLTVFLFSVTGSARIALFLETLFCAVYGLANYFVLNFRGAPIQPWDLFSLSTAASVADNYEYKLNVTAIWVLIGFLFLLVCSLFVRFTLKPFQLRLGLCVLGALGLLGYTRMLHNEALVEQKFCLYNKLYTPDIIQYKNGTLTAFLLELQYIAVEKPSAYDATQALGLLSEYENTAGDLSTSKPNIIVIMNEAFSDPAILGRLEANREYMPFVRSLMAGAPNTISGYLSVPVKGGNTANTEFEYLTGLSTAFLPYGSIPYQQYIRKPLPTIASHLASLGYYTVAMHPYRAGGWNRNTVYPAFGFQQSYFIDFYQDARQVRKYVGDEGDYEKIIRVFEEKPTGRPLFLFNVTMQNHSSYVDWNAYDNFSPDIWVTAPKAEQLSAYLSLIHLSDQAIQELIAYFSKQSEDTLIVFFGDHQPSDAVVGPILSQQDRTRREPTLEEEALRYQVPFFLWANFDIEEESGLWTSSNYLGMKTLEAAGLPQPACFSFLQELFKEAPVLSVSHVLLSDNTLHQVKEVKERLSKYQSLQYYLLFD